MSAVVVMPGDTRGALDCVIAGPEHLDALVAFYRQMDGEQGLDLDASERGLRAALERHRPLDDSDGSLMIFLATHGRDVVGYATVALIPKLDERNGVFFVDELYVLRRHRRKGAASRLLAGIAAEAERRGVWRVRLLTHADNHAARRLYDRHDYDEWRPVFREFTVPRRNQGDTR